MKPTPKIQATAGGGSAALVLIWLLGQFGVQMDALTAGAFVALAGPVAGWVKRET